MLKDKKIELLQCTDPVYYGRPRANCNDQWLQLIRRVDAFRGV